MKRRDFLSRTLAIVPWAAGAALAGRRGASFFSVSRSVTA